MSSWFRLYLLFGVTLVAACFPSVIKHNQHLAAKTAEDFSQFAFVQRNYTAASPLVTANGSNGEISAMGKRLHPSGNYPVRVVAASYEPMPGKESMEIYLEGSGADSTYHYLAIMEGTETKGYKVWTIARSEEPFPGSNHIKPLR